MLTNSNFQKRNFSIKKKVIVTTILLVISTYTSPIANAQTNSAGELYPENYPWVGRLEIKKSDVLGGTCTSSLIGTNWALTAAHCLEGAKEITGFFGGGVNNGGIRAEADYWVSHENFSSIRKGDDIALIHFRNNINFKAISLSTDDDTHLLQKRMYSIGYGNNENNENNGKKLNYNYMDLLNYSLPAKTSTVIMANYKNSISDKISTTCYGDSGGPLIDNSQNYLIGISSFVLLTNAKDCSSTKSSGFTRVSKYINWINKNKESISSKLSQETQFERSRPQELKVDGSKQNEITVTMERNSNATYYILSCFSSKEKSYEHAQNNEIFKIYSGNEELILSCFGFYYSQDKKNSLPTNYVKIIIPKYKSSNMNESTSNQNKGNTSQNEISKNNSKTTIETNRGRNILYEKNQNVIFEYKNPMQESDHKIEIAIGDGKVIYDISTYKSNPTLLITTRNTNTRIACPVNIEKIQNQGSNYERITFQKICINNIIITQLGFQISDKNNKVKLDFYKV